MIETIRSKTAYHYTDYNSYSLAASCFINSYFYIKQDYHQANTALLDMADYFF